MISVQPVHTDFQKFRRFLWIWTRKRSAEMERSGILA